MDRGKLAIFVMFVVACGLGLTSVAYHRWASQGVLAWWGGDMARLIADAPRVEALRLQPADREPAADSPTGMVPDAPPADLQLVDGKSYVVLQRKDVTSAIGLEHLRRGLLDDGNFIWSASPPASQASAAHWGNALVFSDGSRRLVVVFELADRRIGRADTSTTLAIDKIATGWEDFFADLYPTPRRKR